jgi:F420-dependent oxidoreductase-like protein
MRTAALAPTTVLALGFAAVMGSAAPAAATPVRFGIQTSQQDVTYEQIRDIWQAAEDLGFDSAWNFDHFMPILGADIDGACLEGWTMLAALAADTSRIRIGTLVTGNTYRNPALLAKMATTVDHISKGRVYLGIGAAWFGEEHDAYGFPFYTDRERAERLDEALQVITKLWTEDHPSFAGKFYTLKNAPFAPKPVQQPHPPILIGGQGKQWIMPLVGRYAQVWNAPLRLTPDDIRERVTIIKDECRRIGREPCDVEVSAFLVLYKISDIPLAGPVLRLGARMLTEKEIARNVLAGSATEIAEKIRTFVDAGVTHVIVNIQPPYDRELLRRFAEEVMPTFR